MIFNDYLTIKRIVEIKDEPLIDYKIKTLQLAFAELKKYIQRKVSEKRATINFQKLDGVNERLALILKWLSEEPEQIFTVKEIQTRFNISN